MAARHGLGFADISGATSSTYVPVAADVTFKVRVVVTASNADGSVTGTSLAVGPIKPVEPRPPRWPPRSPHGRPRPGPHDHDRHLDRLPTSYTYALQRDKGTGYVAIAGATAATYTVATADVGGKVRVMVTAKNAIGERRHRLQRDRHGRHPAGELRRLSRAPPPAARS